MAQRYYVNIIFVWIISKKILACSQQQSLEHEAEVDEEVGLLGNVAIAQRCTQRTEHRVIVIAGREAQHGSVVEQVAQCIGILTCGNAQEDDVVFGEVHLSLQLCSQELIPCHLDVSNTCEGHLLLKVVAEPLATNHIADDERRVLSEEHASIEHGLE